MMGKDEEDGRKRAIGSNNTSSSTSTISLFQRSSKEIESAESLAMATTTPSSETNGNLNGIGAVKNGHISDEEEQQQQQVIPAENGQAVTNGYHHQQNGYASRLRNAYVNGKSHEKKEEIAAKIMVMNGGHVANGMIMNGHGANGVAGHPKDLHVLNGMINHNNTNGIPRPLRPPRRLRIAQIAPLFESVPPKMYGGTERVVSHLTEELVRRGHDVTLFCSADSQTSAKMVFHESWPAFRLNPVMDIAIPYQWMMEQVRQRADEFDILHFHTMEHFTILSNFMNRSVTTLHGLLSFPDMTTLLKLFNNVPLVSISDDQRTHLATKPNWVGTVYHGIPRNMFPFTEHPSPNGTPYLAFLGRITDVKRPEWAIQIAVKAGIPLRIAAKVDKVDTAHWQQEVKPLIEKHSDLVQFIGEINDSQKGAFLGNALALLFPIDWNEPFGLVMIESLACGTPVVARPCGSVPEVIDDGVSGIIFETIEEGVEAVKRVHELDRNKVRGTFERRFTSEKMAENYLKIYEKMIFGEKDNA